MTSPNTTTHCPDVVGILIRADLQNRQWFGEIASIRVPSQLFKLVRRLDNGWRGWDDPLWAEIFNELPSNAEAAFEAPWEVQLFVDRVMNMLDGPPPDATLTVEERGHLLTAALLNTARACRFEIDLTNPGILSPGFSFEDMLLGGPRELSVTRHPEHLGVTVLKGTVPAATFNGAIRRAERVLDEFLGALRAAGMCQFAGGGLRPDSTLATIRVDDGWHVTLKEEFTLAPEYTERVRGTRMVLPDDLSDPERRELSKDNKAAALNKALARHTRFLKKVLAGATEHASAVRNACRLAVNAEMTGDFGVAMALAFACLEGLLLADSGKEDVVAKLSEAVTHSIARDFDEERNLRKQVKKLYQVRSDFIHKGVALERNRAREETLEIMYRVLRKKAGQLPDPGLVAEAEA